MTISDCLGTSQPARSSHRREVAAPAKRHEPAAPLRALHTDTHYLRAIDLIARPTTPDDTIDHEGLTLAA